ncbi:O-antigen ligase family protein [Protaetiibacter larvae]|uniref:O-antigen ligase-related domain-containing protein n=1 Tax=Protaetiibacter larvae TaxID=2592654 RepID=A0A5C1Y830_9MICO|nr:O-antigen ligase family protein [Protaetiibacter larvae]QEO09518.1 hypothetical protein FLP23_05530 [Protaetiibacter larvae]
MPLDAIAMSVGGFPLRLYMLPLGGLILFSLFTGVDRRRPSWILQLLAVHTVLILLSLSWTSTFADTFQVALGQVFLMLGLWALVRNAGQNFFGSNDLLRWFLVGLVGSAGIAVLQVVLYYSVGLNLGVWATIVNAPWVRPNGLTAEPVWAGLNASLGLVIVVSNWRQQRRRITLLVLFSVVLVLAFSRAALLATLVAVALMGALRIRHLSSSQFSKAVAGALVVVAGAAALVPIALQVLPSGLLQRFDISAALGEDRVSVDQGSLDSRLGIYRLILDKWVDAPLLGHGGGSLAQAAVDASNVATYLGSGELNAGRGSTNLFLTNLYDLGVIGLALIGLVAAGFAYTGLRMARSNLTPLGLATVMTLQYLSANGFRLGVTWVVFSILIVAWLEHRLDHRRDPTVSMSLRGFS